MHGGWITTGAGVRLPPARSCAMTPRQRHVQHFREPLHLRVAPLLRQVCRQHLDGGAGAFVTRTRPIRSRIGPRAARSEAFAAGCSARRRNTSRRRGSAATRAAARARRRRERDRSEDRDAQGRPGSEEVRLLDPRVGREEAAGARPAMLANRLDPLDAFSPVERRQHDPGERVHRPGQDEGSARSPGRACPRGRRAQAQGPEHEAERQRADGVQEGDHRHRDEGRVRAVATGRLAVAADPVPRDASAGAR